MFNTVRPPAFVTWALADPPPRLAKTVKTSMAVNNLPQHVSKVVAVFDT